MKPTPEEKCDVESEGFAMAPKSRKDVLIVPSPSPEARVDWETQAREICDKISSDMGFISGEFIASKIQDDIAKALSAAFEKGREAR